MEQLPAIKSAFGYDLLQIAKNEHGYIYEKSFEGKPVSFEVFRHREKKESVIFGAVSPAQVQYPGNNAFGAWAWDCRTKERAMARFSSFANTPDTPDED